VILYVVNQLQLRWTLRLLAVVAPLALVEGLLLLLVKGAIRRFDQQLLALLQAGKTEALLPLYRQQGLLRFAAPRHYTRGKLGLIYARLQRHAEAADAYREALDSAPDAKRYPLTLGLANSLHAIGDDDAAEEAYREAIDEDHVNVQASVKLSGLIRARAGDLAEAERYLRTAVDAGRDGKLRCELALLLLERGQAEEAAWQHSLAAEELAKDEGSGAALEQVRAALREAGVDPDAPAAPPAAADASEQAPSPAEAEAGEPP